MSELIWLNGEVLPMTDARIHVEDRGFQFADGVYEVVRFYNARPFTLSAHLDRLERSAAGLRLSLPIDRQTLAQQIQKLIDATAIREGMIYLQLTRGSAPRNHVFPDSVSATLLFYARPLPPPQAPGVGEGVKLHAVPDERWKRCWIKSIALLPNILAKNDAIAAGADEAVFVEEGIISECSASNIFAVLNNKLITHPVGPRVLPGITRMVLLELAARIGIAVDERPLRLEEALGADELFITSTTRELNWVTRWDSRPAGRSRCGPITTHLHRAYCDKVRSETR